MPVCDGLALQHEKEKAAFPLKGKAAFSLLSIKNTLETRRASNQGE